eukprot:scaffold387771_cov52-Attheya_sp.AAC.1
MEKVIMEKGSFLLFLASSGDKLFSSYKKNGIRAYTKAELFLGGSFSTLRENIVQAEYVIDVD